MTLQEDAALESVLAAGDDWQSWRALRLSADAPGPPPRPPSQLDDGAFPSAAGAASAGATAQELCHLVILGLEATPAARAAGRWLLEARTPAGAWLDHPDAIVSGAEEPAAGRVWATAAAVCALLACGHDPGGRAIALLRGEAEQDGRLTGGVHPTFAGAAAFWRTWGPTSEMAEWALRWARELEEDVLGPDDLVAALTLWGAAGVPAEHPSVDDYLERLRSRAPGPGWEDDLELTLRTLELIQFFDS